MKIIAHRGCWKKAEEKNKIEAFHRAFQYGFGVETDLRDYQGRLVISHDIANEQSMPCEVFFELYKQNGKQAPLALNIKADGLQNLLMNMLVKYDVQDYFVFDMSIPETVVYKKDNIRFFTRCSDIETECVLYEDAEGVWLDSFFSDSFDVVRIAKKILSDGKKVAIVSPELHGKPMDAVWQEMFKAQIHKEEGVYLCTDEPERAMQYFERD